MVMVSPFFLSAVSLFSVILSLTTCPQFAESLATSPRKKHAEVPNRVFVAGISNACTEQTIRSNFSRFGAVRDVVVIGRDDGRTTTGKNNKRLPCCFVTFDDASSARRAIEAAPEPTGAYIEARCAVSEDDRRRRRSDRSRAEEEEKATRVESFGREANLVVQVQSTHLDRLVERLHPRNGRNGRRSGSAGDDANADDGSNSCRVLGSTNTNSRNVSLLFLSCANPIEFARMLCTDPILARAVNKPYIVQPGLLKGNLATERGCDAFAKILFDEVSKMQEGMDEPRRVIVRVQVYPPKHQSRLLQKFDALINEKSASPQFTIAPRGFTHMISVVEAYQYKGRGWERRRKDDDSRLYMAGVSPASFELDVVDTNNIIAGEGDGDEVSRAYYKLKEALEAYEAIHGGKLELHGSIALDCGSAPGGWTKYLIERFRCREVYSVDPGALSPAVSELGATRHMRMKVQDALPILLEDAGVAGRVKVWVSDMCLHDMGEQVDLLLLAKEKGLLASEALFVLTLKCVVGHSKSSYDAQVERVVGELRTSANVDGLEIFHLFSNRSGERTVIGYIQ